MSEHETDFVRHMEAIYLKVKKTNGMTIKTIVAAASIVLIFGVAVLVQGFQTARESAKVTAELKNVSETQTLMYEVFNTQISDVKAKAVENKGELQSKIEANKEELQRQLDLIMKDRKLVERGYGGVKNGNTNIN